MMQARGFALCAVLLGTVFAGACGVESDRGSFEKTFRVDGHTRLEVENSSGLTQIRPGRDGEVRVSAEYKVHAWLWNDPSEVARMLRESPPLSQNGSTIQVGKDWPHFNAEIDYVVTVPPDTEIRVASGSGTVDVQGLRGPARLRSGSGRVLAADIGDDVEARAGSGTIELARIGGGVRASNGSGRIIVDGAGRYVRVENGSGGVQIVDPSGSVQVDSGSGRVEIRGAREDVHVDGSSGSVTVQGNPKPRAFWEIQTRSGRVQLELPVRSSFTIAAETSSGRIQTDLPLTLTERERRRIRGRAGEGEARIQVKTRSGGITIQ